MIGRRGVMKEYALNMSLLRYRQSLPLSIKVKMTRRRIREFIDYYGMEQVYVSFSGGKDSTVLLDIVRKDFPEVLAVFLDTWLEYPQIRQFVKTFKNVEVIKPTMNLKDIILQYGWCYPSKDVAQAIWYARQGSDWALNKLNGLDKEGNYSEYRQQYKKWLPLYESDIQISPYCCIKQKEEPVSLFEEETGRHPIIGLMAEESARRQDAYLRTGCNSFESDRPMSKAMGFWTVQDVLQYTVENNIKIADVYGLVYEEGQIPGQCSFVQRSGKLKCSGEQRTGCMFCPVGCHLDHFAKFKRLKDLNPTLYDYCMDDLGEKKLLDFIKKNYIKK